MSDVCNLRIAGVRMRLCAPLDIRLPASFQPFVELSAALPDITVMVETDHPPAHLSGGRIYCEPIDADGNLFARFEPEDIRQPYRLYLPPTMAEKICNNGNWLNLLPLERLLMPFHRVILHASAVIYRGKAYVFTAPSGVGKSTQADIWHREFGAEILNGDKVILSVQEGVITAYGSPVAGSSGIYKQCSAPVAAILQLKQSNRNEIAPANDRTGYFAVYSGLVKSDRDRFFNNRLLDYTEAILRTVPVRTLLCRPDRQAAECVLAWLGQP